MREQGPKAKLRPCATACVQFKRDGACRLNLADSAPIYCSIRQISSLALEFLRRSLPRKFSRTLPCLCDKFYSKSFCAIFDTSVAIELPQNTPSIV